MWSEPSVERYRRLKGSKHAHSSAVIILDESGDLRFSARSTRYFVVAATIMPDSNELGRLTKKVRNRLGWKKDSEELKFNTSTESIRMLMLRSIAKMDCQIVWVSFDKDQIPERLKKDKSLCIV